jgi:GNAT superfamily N-acetyltransferase
VIIRAAQPADIPVVLANVQSLIRELSGEAGFTLAPGARDACLRLISDATTGTIVVAVDNSGRIDGVLTVSLQIALHSGGTFAELQEFWVAPDRRSSGIGEQLISAVEDFCTRQGVTMIEVGLPPASFASLARTERFYERMGFAAIGPRRRKEL